MEAMIYNNNIYYNYSIAISIFCFSWFFFIFYDDILRCLISINYIFHKIDQ